MTLVNQAISHYKIVSQTGAGGMGEVYHARDTKLGRDLAIKAANGLGDAEGLLPGANFPAVWSPDGRFVIFLRRGVKTRMDIYALSMFGERREYPMLNSSFEETTPQLSPDGRWLAYASDETGNYEIYVQSFSTDGKLGNEKSEFRRPVAGKK